MDGRQRRIIRLAGRLQHSQGVRIKRRAGVHRRRSHHRATPPVRLPKQADSVQSSMRYVCIRLLCDPNHARALDGRAGRTAGNTIACFSVHTATSAKGGLCCPRDTWRSVHLGSLTTFCSRFATKETADVSRCRFRAPLFFFVTVLLCVRSMQQGQGASRSLAPKRTARGHLLAALVHATALAGQDPDPTNHPSCLLSKCMVRMQHGMQGAPGRPPTFLSAATTSVRVGSAFCTFTSDSLCRNHAQ